MARKPVKNKPTHPVGELLSSAAENLSERKQSIPEKEKLKKLKQQSELLQGALLAIQTKDKPDKLN